MTGFLSEMSAEPIHGGGITLHRILGEYLSRFDWLAKTALYPHETAPSYGPAKAFNFPLWPIEAKLRPWVGCRAACWVQSHPWIRQRFTAHVATALDAAHAPNQNLRLLVCPQGWSDIQVLEKLRHRRRVDYITWVMDDHLIAWNGRHWEYPAGMEALMARHLEQASQVFVISPTMADFYRKRFGVESTVLCGPAAAPIALAQAANLKEAHGAGIRLAYFGSIGPWQNDALGLLETSLQKRQASLDIYTRNPGEVPSALLAAGAKVHPPLQPSAVVGTMGGYDAVVLPVSFRDELRNMSHFNIATKFSECLASPVPTLLIGPKDAAMVRIAEDAGACLVVDRPDPEFALDVVEQVNDTDTRAKVIQAEHDLWGREFSYPIMHKRWHTASEFLFVTS